jgi:serine/threonine-protein kinase RsbT
MSDTLQPSGNAANRLPGRRQTSVKDETRVPIHSDHDIVKARQRGRALAQQMGFSNINLTLIATAISELARNILLYAKKGELTLGIVEDDGRQGIAVVARDDGPGISDVGRAMEIGYSTSGSLGLGLPGVRRLMDDFEIVSRVGRGTTVTARKWRR